MRTGNIIYEIIVKSRSGRPWKIEKTFAEYQALNDVLQIRHTSLPEFPRKRRISHFFQFSEKSDYWNSLRGSLQTYFNALLSDELFRNDANLQEFLQPQREKPTAMLMVVLQAPHKSPDGDLEYVIDVSNAHLNPVHKIEWTLNRHQKELAVFDQQMRNTFSGKKLPAFPERHKKRFVLKYGSEDEAQRSQIETYLNAILLDDTLRGGQMAEEPCVRQLLGIDDVRLRVAMRTKVKGSQQGGGSILQRSLPSIFNSRAAEVSAPSPGVTVPGVPRNRPEEHLQPCESLQMRLALCFNFFTGGERV